MAGLRTTALAAARTARTAALRAARGIGAFDRAANSRWRQQRLLVLCYHGVSTRDEHEWATLYVSQQHLRARLRRLTELGCTILPLAEALERQAARDLPPRAVSITFDDGAADFCTRAYPVLQECAVPAMLYQTTWYVGRGRPVFNTMASYVLWKGAGRTIRLPWVDGPVTLPRSTRTEAFATLHAGLLRHIAERQLSYDEQQALLEEIAGIVGVSLPPLIEARVLQLMDESELRSLDPALVDIQLHTHRHRTPLERSLFVRELDDNAAALRRLLGRPLRLEHFCYPSGVHRPEYGEWLQAWGVRSATTCDNAYTSAETPRLFVPRFIDTMHTPDVLFDAWVTGAAHYVPGWRAT